MSEIRIELLEDSSDETKQPLLSLPNKISEKFYCDFAW